MDARTRRIIVALALFGSNVGVAGVFALMWQRDLVRVCEPILPVRAFELALALGLTILGLYAFIKELRK